MRLFYVLTFALAFLVANSLQAQNRIEDFSSLMSVLNSGGEVKAVFHYGKCQLIMNGEESDWKPDAIGGMSIDVYEYFAKGAVRNERAYVVFSENKLIEVFLQAFLCRTFNNFPKQEPTQI